MNNTLKIKKSRIFEIDFLRGICVYLMFFDHFMFDMFYLIPMLFPYSSYEHTFLNGFISLGYFYWDSTLRKAFRYSALFLFFTLSGISTHFSKSNIKRGGLLVLISIAICLLSIFYSQLVLYVEPFSKLGLDELLFVFPIFWVYGFSLLVYGLIKKASDFLFKKEIYLNIFTLVIAIVSIWFGFYLTPNLDTPIIPFSNAPFFDFLIGKYAPNNQMDYWGLFPYMGLIFLGAFLGQTIYKNRTSLIVKQANVFTNYISTPVTFIGRHALVCYIVQQIPIFIIAFLIYFFTTL